MEFIIRTTGMFLVLSPLIILCLYLSKKSKKKTKFSKHLSIVTAKHKYVGKIIAYGTKIFFFTALLSLGVLFTENLDNFTSFKIFFFTIILYIIFKYFDLKNEN